MSLLARQFAFDPEGFLTRYPCAWLVWEPAGWTPPVSSPDQSLVKTSHEADQARPVKGDPLCFPLKKNIRLSIGRASGNEIVISDATVSRVHAELEKRGEAWVLMAVRESETTTVVGARRAEPGHPVPLVSGDTLELGGAQLSYFDAQSFKVRISTVPLQAAAR